MDLEQRPRRTGRTCSVLLALVCTLGGLAVGRTWPGRKADGGKAWRDVDELHQMHLVPSGYNFVESNKSYEGQLISLIHDRLLHYNPVGDRLVPGLARTYELSPDGLTWTFHLREAKTPDGLRVDAEDVVFSFNLCLDTRFDCKKRGNLIVVGRPIEASAAGRKPSRSV